MSHNAIALDLGGTRVKMGITRSGKLMASGSIAAPARDGFFDWLHEIEREVSDLLSKSSVPLKDIRGMGISIPGIVDSKRMTLLSVNEKYSQAVGFDFSEWAKRNWGLPIAMENDARSALIGEWRYGAGRGCNNLVILTLGTGIGGAALVEGKVLRGTHFQAGILPGHFTVNYQGLQCNCGNVGCVESEASSWRLHELASRSPLYSRSALSKSEKIDYKRLFELSECGDALSRELVGHSMEVWSACVVNLIHAYDPELVIIGGGIMQSGSVILPEISSRVYRHAWTSWGKVRIVAAEQRDYAALLGVSFLLEEMPDAY